MLCQVVGISVVNRGENNVKDNHFPEDRSINRGILVDSNICTCN